MKSKIHIFTDGGSRGNPGPGASAFVAVVDPSGRDYRGGKQISKKSRFLGVCTNNEAEYRALIMSLEWARSREFRDLMIHSDSQLMIKQLFGEYKVKSRRIRPLYEKAKGLLVDVRWSAIHHNREHPWITICDSLVNNELDSRM